MISDRLDPNEEVVTVIRKHWFMFAIQVFILSVVALFPLLAALFIPATAFESLSQIGASSTFLVFLYMLWVLMTWNLAFISWTTYYLDTWIVTNRRIIDIDQRALFQRKVTTLMLEKIQDMTVDVDGLFQTLFGFGTLILHTAGAEDPDIVIRYAAYPQHAKDRILECQRHALSAESHPSVKV